MTPAPNSKPAPRKDDKSPNRRDKWHPRTRAIRVRDCGCYPCFICGKDKAKRAGCSPAPILLLIKAMYFMSGKLEQEEKFGGSLCIACAKRICNRLDAVIDQIQASYGESR